MGNSSIITIKSEMDFETFDDFYKLNFKQNFKTIVRNLLLMVIFLLTLSFLLNVLFRVSRANLINNMIYFVFGLAIIVGVTFFFQRPKRQYKKLFAKKPYVNTFTFSNDGIQIITDSKEAQTDTTVSYTGLLKVYETLNSIILFTNTSNTYLISKASLSADEHKVIINIFKNKTPDVFERVKL